MDSQLHPAFLHPNGTNPLLIIERLLGCRLECQNRDRFGRCEAIRVTRRWGSKSSLVCVAGAKVYCITSYPMISAANSRVSGLSVGKNSTMQSQSFSSCQCGSNSSLCFVPNIARSPFSRVLIQNFAIHRRYTQLRFLRTPYCCLQGITVRPVPCNYNVIQQISALSRRKRGFKSRRGRQINRLGEKRLLSV
jgi:hypothetical protein